MLKEQLINNQEKYKKLITDVKYKVCDLVDKITDDYIEAFIENVDCEIKSIKANKDFYEKQFCKYKIALNLACEEILRLQGYNKIEDDLGFITDRIIELENKFLDQTKKEV